MVPWAYTSQHPSGISIGSAVFFTVHQCDQQADRHICHLSQ